MTVWAKVQGNTVIQFPYTLGSLLAENPFTNFGNDPDIAAIFPDTEAAIRDGYALAGVVYLPEPEYDRRTQKAERNVLPQMQDGGWVLGWTIVDKTAQEIASADAEKASSVRNDRNARLSACDWTQVGDAPISDATKASWAAYRQALRDLPSQDGFPWNVSWPVF